MDEQSLQSSNDVKNFKAKQRHYIVMCILALIIIVCVTLVFIRGYRLNTDIEPIIAAATSDKLPEHLDFAGTNLVVPTFFVGVLIGISSIALLSLILFSAKKGSDLFLVVCLIAAAWCVYSARIADEHRSMISSKGRVGFLSLYDNIKMNKYLISPDEHGMSFYALRPQYESLVSELRDAQQKRLYYEVAAIALSILVIFIAVKNRRDLKEEASLQSNTENSVL